MTEDPATAAGSDSYTVRRYRPDDIDALLELDRAVWDRRRGAEWIEWKYADNPYLDHVPIFVVEHDEEIVGARPFLAFRLRAGGSTAIALQPSDTMVHPEHRRQGLFTRMVRHAIDFYRSRSPTVFFNFPNQQAIGGYRKLGWEEVAPRRAYYRIQNPSVFVRQQVDGTVGKGLGELSTPTFRLFDRLRSEFVDEDDGIEIERAAGVDVETLASLYERRVPARLHALRDETFYEWALASPEWEYATHLARADGEAVAALVTRTRTADDDVTVTQVAEVAPLVGGSTWLDALDPLLASAIDHAADADLVSTVESGIPRSTLAAHGFYPSTMPPLKQLRGPPSTFVTRPVDPSEDDAWRVNGRDLTDRDEWLLTFCEHDTA